jgi:hypothetical protein
MLGNRVTFGMAFFFYLMLGILFACGSLPQESIKEPVPDVQEEERASRATCAGEWYPYFTTEPSIYIEHCMLSQSATDEAFSDAVLVEPGTVTYVWEFVDPGCGGQREEAFPFPSGVTRDASLLHLQLGYSTASTSPSDGLRICMVMYYYMRAIFGDLPAGDYELFVEHNHEELHRETVSVP